MKKRWSRVLWSIPMLSWEVRRTAESSAMRMNCFHTRTKGARSAILSSAGNSYFQEFCTNDDHSEFLHKNNKNCSHKYRSYGCILQFSRWPDHTYYTVYTFWSSRAESQLWPHTLPSGPGLNNFYSAWLDNPSKSWFPGPNSHHNLLSDRVYTLDFLYSSDIWQSSVFYSSASDSETDKASLQNQSYPRTNTRDKEAS